MTGWVLGLGFPTLKLVQLHQKFPNAIPFDGVVGRGGAVPLSPVALKREGDAPLSNRDAINGFGVGLEVWEHRGPSGIS